MIFSDSSPDLPQHLVGHGGSQQGQQLIPPVEVSSMLVNSGAVSGDRGVAVDSSASAISTRIYRSNASFK